MANYRRGHSKGRSREQQMQERHATMQRNMAPMSPLLSITTRGIGFGIARVFFIASYNPNVIFPDIHAIFRASLGLVEGKLYSLKGRILMTGLNTDLIYPYRISLDNCLQLETIGPVQRIVNAIGIVKCNGKTYIPAFMKDVVDEENRFIPRPENLLLSNLRKTVEALSEESTPAVYRLNFYRNNPIPATRWNNADPDSPLLMNPESVIHANYDLSNDFIADSYFLQGFLSNLKSYEPHLAEGKVDTTSNGKLSQFISNEMFNLRLPDVQDGEDINKYYRRLFPFGNIDEFWSNINLMQTDQLEGQVNLLGELYCTTGVPNAHELMYPMYLLRTENAAGFAVNSCYQGAYERLFALEHPEQKQEKCETVQRDIVVPIGTTLSITTRGIGFGIAECFHRVSRSADNLQDIHAIFRASLGMVEDKLSLVKNLISGSCAGLVYNYYYLSYGFAIWTLVPVQRIVNAIGIVKHDGKTYIPAVMKDVVDEENRFIPRPENLLLSNLRKTVVALSEESTPANYRRNFYRNNPIPATKWNNVDPDSPLLMNPDDIIPGNYDLRNDHFEDHSLMGQFVSKVIERYEPRLAGGKFVKSNEGKLTQFISNEMSDLRLPDIQDGEVINEYYKRLIPTGNIKRFWSHVNLTWNDQLEGEVNLLGENPTDNKLMYPMHHLRDENTAGFFVNGRYQEDRNFLYAQGYK